MTRWLVHLGLFSAHNERIATYREKITAGVVTESGNIGGYTNCIYHSFFLTCEIMIYEPVTALQNAFKTI